MEDLVDEMRKTEGAHLRRHQDCAELLRKGAAEIERLRANVRDISANYQKLSVQSERLRVALKGAYGDLQQYVAHGPGSVNLTARLFEIGKLLRDDEQLVGSEKANG